MASQYIKQNLTSLSIPNDEFADLITAVLQNGIPFRFQASGFSMSPFIKNGDVITLSNSSKREISMGDVVAFINPACDKLTIHRVVKIHANGFLMKADNSPRLDGWIEKQHILGYVINVERYHRSVKIGLGSGRQFIAFLSRHNLLMPGLRVLRPFLRPLLKGF